MPPRRLAVWILASTLQVLGACGGGGGGEIAGTPQPPVTYAIHGTVAGLIGTLTLQNNGGDNLTLSANGNFSFATKVASGGSYAVTVSTQPSGPDCIVSSGSGIATADVGNVTVTCSVNSGTRYVPLNARQPGPGKSMGLFVISTKSIERPPVRITDVPVEPIALVPEHTLGANAAITVSRPAMLIYRTVDAAGGDHLWGLDLTAGSNLTPRQIGNLTFRGFSAPTSALPGVCSSKLLLGKLDDPSSALIFVWVTEDAQGSCAVGPIRGYVVRATDTPSISPRDVPAESGSGNIRPLYRPDGALAGIVALDSTSQDLVMFSDETLVSSRLLMAGPVWFESVSEPSHSTWTDLIGSQSSVTIRVNDGSSSKLYRVDHDGAVRFLYDVSSILDVPYRFGTSLYVEDRDLVSSQTVTSWMRIPVDGSTPQALYSFTSIPDCIDADSPIGPLGPKLIVWRICWGLPQGTTSHVLSLPGNTLDVPTTLASYSGVLGNVTVAQDRILVSFSSRSSLSMPMLARWDYATEVLDAAGMVVLPRAPSAFVTLEGDPTDSLLQARDFTGPGFENGALYKLSLGSPAAPAASRLTYADGSPATLPANTEVGHGSVIAPNIVYGMFWDLANAETDVVVDLARGRAVKPAVPGVYLELISFVVP